MAKIPKTLAALAAVSDAQGPLVLDHKTVGERLRVTRKSHHLTLAELSALSGIAVSTISKAERGDIALTYDKFAALAQALHIDFDKLFGKAPINAAANATEITPTLTLSGAQAIYDTPNYEYGMLANALTGKSMVPMRAHIRARKLADFPDYIRHAGEEFVFVLGGKLCLQFEDGQTFTLSRGDSLYFNSAIGHVYLSAGKGDAEVLVCCVDAELHRSEGVI
jgi:transcriptional regulator with XRE-family HTH domain